MKKMYHATSYNNLLNIIDSGLKPGFEGLVYLTENEDDAVKFLLVRGIKDIVTFEVSIDKNDKVVETFDHSYQFFKCRCFGKVGNIPANKVKPSKRYQF